MGQVPGDKGALLRAERLAAVERIGGLATERQVDFVIVAGDLFDAHTVDNEIVTRALEVLSRFSVPIYAIPGNHDFSGAPESVYARKRFIDRCPKQLHLLDEKRPVAVTGCSVTLLPCPLLQRHTVVDPTRWLTDDTARTEPNQIRVAIAHGSIVDFESEEGGTTPNLIDPAIVDAAKLDYLALGDWHGTRRVADKAWYSGTPEPDRFKENQSGNVLIVEIDSPGAIPKLDTIRSAGCQWFRRSASIHDADDLAALEQWFSDLSEPQKTLVRLEYEGVLGMEELRRFGDLLDTQAELLLYLRHRGNGVQLEPTDEELESLGREGLTGRVAETLRQQVGDDSDDGRIASLALQMLFQCSRSIGGE